MNKALTKYFRTRAVSNPWQISGHTRSDFRAAIVIPALAEAESLPKTLTSLSLNPPEFLQQTLALVVVNNRIAASTADQQENQRTLSWLQENPYSQLNLAWVDATSPGLQLPGKDGVGLARKIGFDLALTRLDWQLSPLLISLDADTLVARDYLPAIFSHFQASRCAGAVLPFRHQVAEDPRQEAAIRHYELYLRSYLFGLRQAASPYAYHAIGSAFACTAQAYVAAGGMNRRQAGEDFYFLQQLAKCAGIETLQGTRVQPAPRFSKRVPFGTGRAVQACLSAAEQPFAFCPAEAFQVLREWLQLVQEDWQHPAAQIQIRAGAISDKLATQLERLGFVAQWQRWQRDHQTQAQFLRAFHGWYDALRSRQLLSCWAESMTDAEERRLVRALLEWGGLELSGDLLSLLEEQI